MFFWGTPKNWEGSQIERYITQDRIYSKKGGVFGGRVDGIYLLIFSQRGGELCGIIFLS